MKAGDYVRTKKGIIGKIEDFVSSLTDDYVKVENQVLIRKKVVIKSSPNIIDLIEVGDIVITPLGEIIRPTSSNVDELKDYWKITRNPIKSIVTHEQFESMEYKL